MPLKESTRAYIYRILMSVSPIVVGYGLLTGEQAALWLSLIANILGVTLAAANTSTGRD